MSREEEPLCGARAPRGLSALLPDRIGGAGPLCQGTSVQCLCWGGAAGPGAAAAATPAGRTVFTALWFVRRRSGWNLVY